MTTADGRAREVLAFTQLPESVVSLAAELNRSGAKLDVVADLAELRRSFFQSGGHELLVLAPDLTPRLATTAARGLREVDPSLRIVAFGEVLGHQAMVPGCTNLVAFHPTSRAGIGAVLRLLAME